MQDVLSQVLRRLADLERRMALSIRVGRVAEVQVRPYRVRVNLGSADRPVVTGPLHVLIPRSGRSMVDFSPLDVDEGVLVLAPGGSDSIMFVLPSLVRGRGELIAPPSDARYVIGDLVLTGDVQAGKQFSLGVVEQGGVSLKGHKHGSGNIAGTGGYQAPAGNAGGPIRGDSGPPKTAKTD